MALRSEVDAQFTDVEVVVIGQAETQQQRERAIASIRSAVPYGVALKLTVTVDGE